MTQQSLHSHDHVKRSALQDLHVHGFLFEHFLEESGQSSPTCHALMKHSSYYTVTCDWLNNFWYFCVSLNMQTRQGGDDPAAQQCPICQDDALNCPVETNCGHSFCASCILRWCRNHNSSCPVCRRQVCSAVSHV